MKKIILTIVFSSMITYGGLVSWTGDWAAYNSGDQLFINSVEVFDGWQVGLYQSTGTNPGEGFNTADLSANFLASTDVLIDTAGPEFTWSFKISSSTPYLDDNIPIYTVLFNTTDSSIFTTTPETYNYLVIDDTSSAAFNSGTEPSTSINPLDYDVGTVAANNWQAVPEPASMALIALGGVLTWLFNLKKRFS